MERRDLRSLIGKIGLLAGMPIQMLRRLHTDLNHKRLSETACRIVSSRGIARSCHALVDLRFSQDKRIRPDLFRQGSDASVYYVFTDSVPEFAAHYLPRIEQKFTLVSGADDTPVSRQVIGPAVDAILDHRLLVRWFAQNADFAHSKLELIPIGMDYHTLAGNHRRPWRRFQSPVAQEKELRRVLAQAPPVAERACSAYANWHFSLQRGDRQECIDRIAPDCVHFEPKIVPRRQSWTNNARHLFTISPLGNGMDCHRTWEALFLGTIPVVHTSALDALYDGLPVCIVSDWSEVTSEFLHRQRQVFLDKAFDYSRIFLDFWRGKILSRSTPDRSRLTIADFVRLVSIDTTNAGIL